MPAFNQTSTPVRGFIALTRVYKKTGVVAPKTQRINVAKSSIESVRPRTKLAGTNTTLVTTSGKYINVAETYNDVLRKLAAIA